MGFKLTVDGMSHEIEIVRRRPHLVLSIDGQEHEVSVTGTFEDGRQTIEVAGSTLHFTRAHSGEKQIIRLGGRSYETALVDPRSNAQAKNSEDVVRAPMPGLVVSLHKKVGDEVKRGETIITIESMKLQTALLAPRDGSVAELLRAEGEPFEKDEVIVRLEAEKI
jgi:biotin carboxyl carrier protein